MWVNSKAFFDDRDPGNAFAACCWHELFDEFTPDTFHPKLFSLPMLVDELSRIGELEKNSELWKKHITQIQQEIKERCTMGHERQLCNPRESSLLNQIANLESRSDALGSARMLSLDDFAISMETRMRTQLLETSFPSFAGKKSNLEKILRTLGCYAFHRGASSVDTQIPDEILSQNEPAIKEWILSALPTQTKEFDCILAIETTEPKLIASIRSLTELKGFTRASSKLPGIPKELSKKMLLQKRANGLRAIDAIDSLKKEVRADLNLLSLYEQKKAPSIQMGGWIVEDSGRAKRVERSHSLMNLHPRTNALELSKNAAESLNQIKEPAILAALDLHDLALSMPDHRLRLSNLWSATECISSIVDGGSIIDRVERLMIPILTWRKIDWILRYLAISVHLWLKANPGLREEALAFTHKSRGSVLPEELLPCLTDQMNGEKIKALLNLVSGHPLLLHRISHAWELFTSPSKLRQNLARSEKRLKWHLNRIYRARNLLVHHGIESPFTPQLADHLQHYFSATISRILHGISKGPHWTASDSFHHWRSHSAYVLEGLGNSECPLSVGDLFPERARNPDEQVWPAKGEEE